MTWYEFLLFFHIAMAAVWVGGATMLALLFRRQRRPFGAHVVFELQHHVALQRWIGCGAARRGALAVARQERTSARDHVAYVVRLPHVVVRSGLETLHAVAHLGFVMLGLASTAPVYSLAATLGLIVAVNGNYTPLILVLGFIPVLFIAYAFRELYSAMPDCGSSRSARTAPRGCASRR